MDVPPGYDLVAAGRGAACLPRRSQSTEALAGHPAPDTRRNAHIAAAGYSRPAAAAQATKAKPARRHAENRDLRSVAG